MQLTSVNVGQERPMPNAKAWGRTGIYKLPVEEAVEITHGGLAGDAICDLEHHGGADQAVYIYSTPDYAWWSGELGRQLVPGTFGENLTITELESAQVGIGDRLHIGAVILEVTAPRMPCVTLATRMGDPAFAERFRAAERPGLYARVVRAGWVQAGDTVTRERLLGETVTVIELFRDFYRPDLTEATLRRHLAAPIAVRDRVEKERRLAELLA